MSTAVCKGPCPKGYRQILLAVSGGTLEGYIRQAMAETQGRLCLRLSPQYIDFPLPCSDGCGQELTAQDLKECYDGQTVHFSPELVMEYFTYLSSGQQLHVVLYDSQKTLREKYRLAKHLGVPSIQIPDPNLRRLINAKG